MTNFVINVTTVQTVVEPGVVPAGYVMDLVDASGAIVHSQPFADLSAFPLTLPEPAPGTYTAQVKRLDANGAVFGAIGISAPETIAAPVLADSVGTVTISLG